MIWNLHFHLQGARSRIDCAGYSCHRAVKLTARKFLQQNLCFQAFTNLSRISLRHEHVHAERIALHETEQRRAQISSPSCHKRSDIDIAGCDFAGKRCEDLLETLN